MDNEPFSKDEAPADIESLLRSLAPAKCEIPQETMIYRCGFEAGRKSMVTTPPPPSSYRRWNDLLLSACLVALMIGPASYWAGTRTQSARELARGGVAQNDNTREQHANSDLDKNALGNNDLANPNAEDTNQIVNQEPGAIRKIPPNLNGGSDARIGLSVQPDRESPSTSLLAQQIAKLTLQNARATLGAQVSADKTSQYLTARPLLFGDDFEGELARIASENRMKAKRTEGADNSSTDSEETPILTPYIKRSTSGELPPQWKDLIQ